MTPPLIICASHNTKNIDAYKKLLKRGIPMVFFDRTVDGIPVSKVKIDDYTSAFFMMEHLIYQGRRRIIHLAGPDFIQNSHERKRAYMDVVAKFKLPFQYVEECGVSIEDGEKAAKLLIQSGIEFDAIFCFTENVALGVQRYLQKNHLSIPKDVAICSVSGTILSDLVSPSMTVIEQPIGLMAEKSVELILEKIKNPETVDKEITLPTEMKKRESTENQSDK